MAEDQLNIKVDKDQLVACRRYAVQNDTTIKAIFHDFIDRKITPNVK